ncbi:MAG: Gfo/Idh/MocA family oxidoreductase [Rhodospirillaceae bacterium]|jgi:predicted dehydrogenase|nr:Gfo/Idh/MocA family oxidoreductase [Rhodospirillaceae bacterium]MBT3491887.1 Gfo/Idh/MocA family oxidoreductase [Rhodospirillaceae bacterium]MBT3780651.1 Gfo/Idh/MocA family oxidoreductase [Rhodospirillaceae bacterium]MBT3978053.1 Gfo/Idh/MocA family oxidoreductase [Rhodospirillaceae bacterium]MBT4166725.1 Gfo/Idh/MocA family oxidoreductase [Rhodospirillaceae bacterium]
MPERLRVAVVGVGHFGRLHAEKYAAMDDVELVAVVDQDAARGAEIAAAHGCQALEHYQDLAGKVDAASLTVPTSLHHSVGLELLEMSLSLLVEKPITETVDSANALIATAKARGLTLQVGHLERFSPAYFALAERVSKPLFIEANRIAPFQPRAKDVNVVLDLMIHDIDLIMALVKSPLISVDAVGAAVVSEGEDIVSARLGFASGCAANLTASRVSLKTERSMRIFQPDAYLVADLAQRKVTSRRKGEGEMFPGIPNIETEEFSFEQADALAHEIADFVRCVRTKETPAVNGEAGRDAVQAALMITDSLQAHRRLLEQSGVI